MIRRQLIFTTIILVCLVAANAGPAAAQGGTSVAPAKQAAVPAPSQTGVSAGANRDAQQAEDYKIGPGDLLVISVWKNEALTRTVPVRPDGKISFPLLNDVQAAGRTPSELRDALAKKLEEYMPAPEVTVIVSEVRSFNVSVIGEVAKPGRFELKSPATVLEALAQAGGFKDFASRTRIVILRHDGTTSKRIPFNYNKVTSADGEQENFYLQPGDIVLVP